MIALGLDSQSTNIEPCIHRSSRSVFLFHIWILGCCNSTNVPLIFYFQPETHFFLGNMLSAKGNLTGAIWHYEEALNQNLGHVDAFNMLRILKCYLKFHRTAQSAAPKESTAPCCNKGSNSPTAKKVESKINCKNVSVTA